jgi:hypothetical protein
VNRPPGRMRTTTASQAPATEVHAPTFGVVINFLNNDHPVPGLRVGVDGEEGFNARLEDGSLELRKGPKRVRMAFAQISSVRRGRRPRYSKTMFWIGIALLPALGFGAVILAIYHFSVQEALIIAYNKRKYALAGDERTLRVIRERIGHERRDMDISGEE